MVLIELPVGPSGTGTGSSHGNTVAGLKGWEGELVASARDRLVQRTRIPSTQYSVRARGRAHEL